MAERLSTGFINALNTVGCVKDIMANSRIDVYSGIQPATADAIETGNLLLTYTLASGAFTPGNATNGLNMGLSSDGVLAKALTEVWSGVGTALAGTGTVAKYFRWRANNDVAGATTTGIRIDGAIGTSSAYEIYMTNNIIATGASSTLTEFNYTIPKQ